MYLSWFENQKRNSGFNDWRFSVHIGASVAPVVYYPRNPYSFIAESRWDSEKALFQNLIFARRFHQFLFLFSIFPISVQL
jgi:hypothetical protein